MALRRRMGYTPDNGYKVCKKVCIQKNTTDNQSITVVNVTPERLEPPTF
jgi:hypothetical protein